MQGLDAVEGEGEPYIDPTTGDTTTYVMAGDPVAGTGWLDLNPSDRRMMMSSGPFDMEPVSSHGDSIVIGHGTDRLNSITVMRSNDIAAQEFFDGNFLNIEPTINPRAPLEYALYQNYPNPFNSSTLLRFDIKQPGRITLTVYDVLGRTIAVLAEDNLPIGSYSIPWNAVDLPSGIYFCQLICDNFHYVKKMVLLK
jgi:hypothetical protein